MNYKETDTFNGVIKNQWGYYYESCIRMAPEKMFVSEIIKVAEFFEEEARKARLLAESSNYRGKMVASVMKPYGTGY